MKASSGQPHFSSASSSNNNNNASSSSSSAALPVPYPIPMPHNQPLLQHPPHDQRTPFLNSWSGHSTLVRMMDTDEDMAQAQGGSNGMDFSGHHAMGGYVPHLQPTAAKSKPDSQLRSLPATFGDHRRPSFASTHSSNYDDQAYLFPTASSQNDPMAFTTEQGLGYNVPFFDTSFSTLPAHNSHPQLHASASDDIQFEFDEAALVDAHAMGGGSGRSTPSSVYNGGGNGMEGQQGNGADVMNSSLIFWESTASPTLAADPSLPILIPTNSNPGRQMEHGKAPQQGTGFNLDTLSLMSPPMVSHHMAVSLVDVEGYRIGSYDPLFETPSLMGTTPSTAYFKPHNPLPTSTASSPYRRDSFDDSAAISSAAEPSSFSRRASDPMFLHQHIPSVNVDAASPQLAPGRPRRTRPGSAGSSYSLKRESGSEGSGSSDEDASVTEDEDDEEGNGGNDEAYVAPATSPGGGSRRRSTSALTGMFQCACLKTFASLGSLRQHAKNHHSNKTKDFVCSTCSKVIILSFTSMDEVYNRLFSSQPFLRKQDLRRHENTHTGIRPFTCPHNCGTTFSRNDALQRHLKVRRCLK
ncbi:hypothetical protein HK101_002981 [Irineochytrium annulatum]|nr:hypothetical protein HK101_002981 [Irineochytrium annulatum]